MQAFEPYGELRPVGLAFAEGLNGRCALIEMAHQGRPEARSYEGADKIRGVRGATDGTIVDPAPTQHAALRQAAKAEILPQNRLEAEERRHAGRRTDDGDKTTKPDNRQRKESEPPLRRVAGRVFYSPYPLIKE